MLGAEGEMLDPRLPCYGWCRMLSLPTLYPAEYVPEFLFTAEKPRIWLYFTVGAGCTQHMVRWIAVAGGHPALSVRVPPLPPCQPGGGGLLL